MWSQTYTEHDCEPLQLGYSSLAEIAAIRVRFGLGIERDMHFRPRFAMSVYAEAARADGRIVARGTELDAAANYRKDAAISRPAPP